MSAPALTALRAAVSTSGRTVLRRTIRARPIIVPSATLPSRLLYRPLTILQPGPGERRDYEIIEPTASVSVPISAERSSSSAFGPNAEAGPSSASSSTPIPPDGASTNIATHLPAPPESIATIPPRHLTHPFDTHAFVSYLEKSDITRPSARALMEAVKELIITRGSATRETMVGKEDMENAAYLFKAALSELRTELSVQARNDGLALKAMAATIRREVEQLEQKLKEDVQTLKHDIEMDMNNRKAETRTEQKGFDIYIEEINNKFTISLGDLRTEIESAKWDATRRAISIIFLIVVAAIAVSTYLPNDTEGKAAPASPPTPSSPSPSATKASAPMRDMAVGTDEELLEDIANIDVGSETEKRLEKLLSEQGVTRIRTVRIRDAKEREKEEEEEQKRKLDVDRI